MEGGPQDDRKPTAATTKREKKWYFTSEQLRKTPSSPQNAAEVAGKDAWYRLQCAELVQAIGSRLRLPQIAINTAILYMHRFYQFHTMKRFHRETMAPVFVFLAAKVEETPRRLDDVIRHTYKLLNVDGPELNAESEKYSEAVQDLTTHENVLVQTLAFDLSVTHPHTHVIQCCQSLQNAIRMDEKKGLDEKSRMEKEAITKDLSHAAYALASCSLHYTLLCIQYSPVMVAAMCISVASAWTKVPLPSVSTEGKHWYEYMDATLTWAQIEQVKGDFLDAIGLYPQRIREKIVAQVMGNGRASSGKAPAPAVAPGVANNKSVTIPQDPTKRTQTPTTSAGEGANQSKLGLQVTPQKAGEAHPPASDRPRPTQPPPPPPPTAAKRPVPAPPAEARPAPPPSGPERQPGRPQQGLLPPPTMRFAANDFGREVFERDVRPHQPQESAQRAAPDNGPRSDRPVTNSNSKRPSDPSDTPENANKRPRTSGT